MTLAHTSVEEEDFLSAQRRLLRRYGLSAESLFVDVPAIGGRAHVLKAGRGPALVMVIGGTIPAAMWAPLMPELPDRTLYAVDLPGFGLTHALDYESASIRVRVTEFLDQVLDAIGVRGAPFVTNSQGSLWTTWLSLARPGRVTAQVQIGCPAHLLGTTAPLPMRLLSIRPLGRLLLRLQPPSPRQVDRTAAMVGEDFSDHPELRDMLLACERLPGYGGHMIALLHAVMRFGRPRAGIALTAEELERVSHPVQMIWGRADPFAPASVGARAAAFLREGELQVIEGGHAPWFDAPARVGTLARGFLRAHGAGGAAD